MILTKDTVCSRIVIRSPRWKQRVVGIANFRVMEHNEIEILAEDKEGKRYYPNVMYASGDMIRACEVQHLSSGLKLYLVPIANLEPLERADI